MNHSEAVSQMAAEQYLLDEMGPDARDEFEEHLFDCPVCSLEVRAGDAFLREAKIQLPALETADAANACAPAAVLKPAKEKRDWLAWMKMPWLVPVGAPAFALLLGVVSYQNLVTLPALEHAASEPQILPSVTPLRAATRGAAPRQQLTASRADGVAVSLDASTWESYPSYAFELATADGKPVWSRTVPVSSKQPVVQIPGAKLANGSYTLSVTGVSANGDREPVTSYVFDVNVK